MCTLFCKSLCVINVGFHGLHGVPIYILYLYYQLWLVGNLIIIIIVKKDWQCKARRGRLTPYQYEYPSPTLPAYRGKEDKGKIAEDKIGESNQANKKALDLLLKPANPTPSNTGLTRSFQRDTEREIKVLRYCEVLQLGGAKVYR